MRKKRGYWSANRVVQEIRARRRNGLPLNRAAIHPTLAQAACAYCGSWNLALRAAGLDPAKIRKRQGKTIQFTAQWVVEEIRRRNQEGERLSPPHVGHRLLNAARRRWGRWRLALQAAGFASYRETRWHLEHPRRPRRPSGPHRVRIWNLPHCLVRGQCLHEALRHAKRSWGKVLRDSGTRWIRERRSRTFVLESIQAEYARGSWVTSGVMAVAARWIYRDGLRHFGTWNQALAAAGVPVQSTAFEVKGWIPPRVIEEIRKLSEKERQAIRQYPPLEPLLYYQARRWFGTWEHALEASRTKGPIVEVRRVLS